MTEAKDTAPMPVSTTSRRDVVASAALVAGVGFPPVSLAMNSSNGASAADGQTYMAEKIEFGSHGDRLIGWLFLPVHTSKPVAGVVILGPFGFIKEMSPAQYGSRLAEAGLAALIFDPRGSGESDGAIRRLEDPRLKVEDLKSATTYLAQRPEINPKRIGALGICQGCSEVLASASEDPRLRALALISGQYIYPTNLEGFFAKSGIGLKARIARGREAKARFELTGIVDYLPVVGEGDPTVALPWQEIYDWYYPWTTQKWGEPSRWENRYAVMSDAFVWTFNVENYAKEVRQPTLVVHGERSDGGVTAAQHVFERLGASDKRLSIIPQTFHTRFYDDPLVVGPAAAEAADWLTSHLS